MKNRKVFGFTIIKSILSNINSEPRYSHKLEADSIKS